MKASLYIRFRLSGRYVTTRPAYTAQGRIRPGFAMVDDEPERHESAVYVLRYVKDGKPTWETVGPDANLALAALDRKNHELNGAKLGIAPVASASIATPGKSLAAAIKDYLEEVEQTKKPGTYDQYEVALRYFGESCKKSHIQSLDRKDMLAYAVFLKDKKKLCPRTAYNKFQSVMTFLGNHDLAGIVRKGDWPPYTEANVEIYEQAELDEFFAGCTDRERLWFRFFLMTGMREQEVMYTAWSDVDFEQSTVKVTAKLGWTPKAYKEREIPIPSSLLAELSSIKPAKLKGLIFGTSDKDPRTNFLEICKAIAVRAGLDRDDCYLHKFRATFATMHLRAGVDLRTVQEWMGHTDLASTMRYLKPNGGPGVRQKVNATFSSFGNG